jgi:hypothetical protein
VAQVCVIKKGNIEGPIGRPQKLDKMAFCFQRIQQPNPVFNRPLMIKIAMFFKFKEFEWFVGFVHFCQILCAVVANEKEQESTKKTAPQIVKVEPRVFIVVSLRADWAENGGRVKKIMEFEINKSHTTSIDLNVGYVDLNGMDALGFFDVDDALISLMERKHLTLKGGDVFSFVTCKLQQK